MTELTDPAVIARKAGWPRLSAAAATAVLARGDRAGTAAANPPRHADDLRVRTKPHFRSTGRRRTCRVRPRSRPPLLQRSPARFAGRQRGLHGRMVRLRRTAELARLAALNMPALDRWRRAVRPVVAGPQAALSWCARNTPKRSRRRIAAHYDIGNDLFSLMLDETMTYSCAIFEPPAASLHQAQLAKLDRICRKLELGPSDHVLEIGSGWAGSPSTRRVATAAGHHHHDLRRAAPAGAGADRGRRPRDRITVLLQTIAISRARSTSSCRSNDRGGRLAVFRHLLRTLRGAAAPTARCCCRRSRSTSAPTTWRSPSGASPTRTSSRAAVYRRSRSSRARGARDGHAPDRARDLTTHYVQTLRCWRENFLAHLERVRSLGYDGRFQRMWSSISPIARRLRRRRIGNVQLLLANRSFARRRRVRWRRRGP